MKAIFRKIENISGTAKMADTTRKKSEQHTLISWSFDTAASREFVPSLRDVRGRRASAHIIVTTQFTINLFTLESTNQSINQSIRTI